jgi:hypothetical protein
MLNSEKKVGRDASFIPNSFQTPNDYVDQFMHLLSGEEFKVLTYTARRIFGFQKRQDQISLTQYQTGLGITDERGALLDHGTGLSRPAVIKALTALVLYRLVARVGLNDSRSNEGDSYALQLDASKVDVAGLEDRDRLRREANSTRTLKARSLSPRTGTPNPPPPSKSHLSDAGKSHLPAKTPEPGQSHLPNPVSGTDRARSVALTEPGKSHLHTITSGKSRGNPEETHPPQTEPAPGHGGTAVGEGGTRHSLEVRKAHATRNGFGAGWLINSADGRYDDGIDYELERLKPESIEARRTAPRSATVSLGAARDKLKSIARGPTPHNFAEEIGRMQLEPGVREQLVEEFCPRGSPAAV